MRRVLWGCIATCLLAGLVLVPVTGEDDGSSASLSTASTTPVDGGDDIGDTTTTGGGGGGAAQEPPAVAVAPGIGAPAAPPPAAGAGGGGGGGSTAEVPGGGAPATTVAPLPPPEDLGPAADPGPTAPPRAGTYRYRARARGEERETTTTVEDRGTNPLGTSQVISHRGGGLDVSSDVSWRKDGVVVLKSVFTFGQTKGDCDWEPDFLQAKLPLAEGVAWRSTSSCMVSGFGPTLMTVTRSLDARVTGLRRVRIAGRPVDAWTIEATDRFEIAGRVIEQKGSSLFSPKHGLVVSSSGTATVTGPDGSQSSDYSSELLNLDPA